jgi:hypothetical protein
MLQGAAGQEAGFIRGTAPRSSRISPTRCAWRRRPFSATFLAVTNSDRQPARTRARRTPRVRPADRPVDAQIRDIVFGWLTNDPDAKLRLPTPPPWLKTNIGFQSSKGKPRDELGLPCGNPRSYPWPVVVDCRSRAGHNLVTAADTTDTRRACRVTGTRGRQFITPDGDPAARHGSHPCAVGQTIRGRTPAEPRLAQAG